MAKGGNRKVGIPLDQYKVLVAKGLVPPLPGNFGKGKKAKELVEESFTPPGTWVIPVKTASEGNVRSWRVKSNRTKDARREVSEAMGKTLRHLVPFAEAYHAGKVVNITLTRLGGQMLDRLANLGMSLKAVEDAVALMMGANDGAKNWNAVAAQEPGGPMGVRVEISLGGEK